MHYFQLTDNAVQAIAAMGVSGVIALLLVGLRAENQRALWRLVGIACCWATFPTLCWLVSFWDGPSTFFKGAEACALLVAPLAAGVFHRSWKVAAATLAVPVLSLGIMMAGLIVIMGDGR